MRIQSTKLKSCQLLRFLSMTHNLYIPQTHSLKRLGYTSSLGNITQPFVLVITSIFNIKVKGYQKKIFSPLPNIKKHIIKTFLCKYIY